MNAGNLTPRDGAKSPRREVPAVRRACSALWLLAQHLEGLNLSQARASWTLFPAPVCIFFANSSPEAWWLSSPTRSSIDWVGASLSLGRSTPDGSWVRSGFDQAELRRRFAAVRWQDPPSIRLWLDEVRTAGRDGYAVDNGNFRKGITSIAAAVPEMDGGVHRTISVTAITAQLNAATRNNLLTAVRSAAAKISKALR